MNTTETTLTLADVNALDSLTSISTKVRLWTGAKRLTAQDLPIESDKLPPKDLATLGSMKMFDPKKLAPFSSIKYEANSLLKRHGIEYAMGYLIPDNLVDMVLAELKALQTRFQGEKDTLYANYDDDLDKWIAKHKTWEDRLRDNAEDKDSVRGRFSFGWRVIKLNLAQSGDGGDAVEESNKELADLLFEEIAKIALDADKKSYRGKTAVTRKALSPLKTLHTKLKGLVFVDPLVAPVISMIENGLNAIPKRGLITGPSLDMLKGLVSRLSSADNLKQDAIAILTGQPLTALPDSLNDDADDLDDAPDDQPDTTPADTAQADDDAGAQMPGAAPDANSDLLQAPGAFPAVPADETSVSAPVAEPVTTPIHAFAEAPAQAPEPVPAPSDEGNGPAAGMQMDSLPSFSVEPTVPVMIPPVPAPAQTKPQAAPVAPASPEPVSAAPETKVIPVRKVRTAANRVSGIF